MPRTPRGLTMIRLLLILSFVLVHLHEGDPTDTHAPGGLGSLVRLWAAMAILWAFGQFASSFAARRMDKGALAWSAHARVVIACTRALGVAVLGVFIYSQGVMESVRAAFGDGVMVAQTIVLAPFWSLIAAGYLSEYGIERRVRDALLYRALQAGSPIEPIGGLWSFFWLELRHEMLWWLLPLCFMSGAAELADRFFAKDTGALSGLGEFEIGGAKVAVSLVVFCIMPLIVRHVWRATDLGPGELRERILSIPREHGVRLRGPVVWRTGSGLLNAMVLGVLYPLRYMVFTDRLLETLTPSQLDAVTAHEVAHLKLRHGVWLVVASLGVLQLIALAISCAERAAAAADASWWVAQFKTDAYDALVALGSLTIAGIVICWVLRRFEWEADAFAVKHLSRADPAAATISARGAAAMSDALIVVAYHNGIHEDRADPLHGTIAQRCARVRALTGAPLDALPIDRRCAWIRRAALVLLVLAGGANLALEGVFK